MTAFLTALVLASLAPAHASSYDELVRLSEQVGKACETPRLACQGEFRLQPIRARGGLERSLQAVADDQNNGWADTILEGDYTASHVTELVAVQHVLIDGVKHAYRIVYRAKAYDTSGARRVPGFITEAAFVSLDFKSTVVDDQALASFSRTR